MLRNLVAAGRCKYSMYPGCQLQYLEAMGGQPALALKKLKGFQDRSFTANPGQNPTGQNPTGQNPYGQNPTRQNPTGQNPTT